jgi:hypothetical protein
MERIPEYTPSNHVISMQILTDPATPETGRYHPGDRLLAFLDDL